MLWRHVQAGLTESDWSNERGVVLAHQPDGSMLDVAVEVRDEYPYPVAEALMTRMAPTHPADDAIVIYDPYVNSST